MYHFLFRPLSLFPSLSLPLSYPPKVMEDPAPTLPEGYSAEFQSFVDDCLEKDPFKRQTAEQVGKREV